MTNTLPTAPTTPVTYPLTGAFGTIMGASVKDAQAWFTAAVANGGNPATADLAVVAVFIQGLKDDGIWNRIDRIGCYAGRDLATDCINIRAPKKFKGVATAPPPTKTPYRSITGQGANSAIDEGYNPATQAISFTLNNAGYSLFCLTNAQSNTPELGHANARLTNRNTSNQPGGFHVNDATNDTTSGILDSTGLWMGQRQSATDKRLWHNGAQVIQFARPATSITSANVFVCGSSSGGGNTKEIAFTAWHDGLAGFEQAFYNRVVAFLTALTGLPDFTTQAYSAYEGDYFETALGPKNGEVSFSLNAGQDATLFTLVDNVLRLPAQVFAAPADANADNVYVAPIRATHTSNGIFNDTTISVTVMQLTVGSAVRYILPTAAGTGDGSSWANAATLTSLDAMIQAVGPGGTINVGNQGGPYGAGATISHGGGASSPVLIRGVDASLNPAQPVFTRGRTSFVQPPDPETPTDVSHWVTGSDVFVLNAGANNLKFQNFAPQDAGSFISAAASLHGIEVNTVTAWNLRRLFEMGTGLCLGDMAFKNITLTGYSKQAFRFRGASHDWLFDTCVLDSARQNKDGFAVGVQMSEYAHGVVANNCVMKNAYDDTSGFWNGDGFSAEATNYDIAITGGEYSGNTDAGIDIKATPGASVTISNVLAKDNKNNIKLWGNNAGGSATFTLSGVVSRDPRRRGGTGAANHIDGANGSAIIIKAASAFHDTDGSGALYAMENYAGAYHVAGDTVEDSLKPRTSFFTGTTIDSVIP